MTTCIGWYDPDGCTYWDGDHHGCVIENHRGPKHRCGCGDRLYGNSRPTRSGSDPTVEHGSRAMYFRHLRDGETPCVECRRANALYRSEQRQRKAS